MTDTTSELIPKIYQIVGNIEGRIGALATKADLAEHALSCPARKRSGIPWKFIAILSSVAVAAGSAWAATQ